jgi:hypothetical protein
MSITGPTIPYLVPLAGAALASAGGVLSAPAFAAVAGSAVACALVRLTVEYIRVETAREWADRWIGVRTGEPPSDEILCARIAELQTARTRRDLGRTFRRIATDASGAGRPLMPAQLNRPRLRRHTDDLLKLADRLEDLSSPVTPRGVALARRLVTAGGGPLYNSQHADALGSTLTATIVTVAAA